MMMAWELGMTKGDYVFYTIEMLPEENVLNPQDVWASNDGLNIIAKQAFEAVFHVRRSHFNRSDQNLNSQRLPATLSARVTLL